MINSSFDRVDPAALPKRALNSGSQMPAIGLGTFGSDRIDNDAVARAVEEAIAIGYRHIDCASVYGNEREIGEKIKEIVDSGKVARDELWITSKLWNDKHAPEDVIPSLEKTLSDLQLEYVDLYLVHWPFPNFHAKGCDVTSRSTEAKPYIHENFLETWRQLERAVEIGLAKNIGTSNMSRSKLELLLADCRIRPAVNEMELHPHFQQQELFDYVVSEGIQPVGFCPIGSPARPERDKTEADTVDTEDPLLLEIAKRRGLHTATLCVKWAEQRGQIPIPFSTNPKNMLANIESLISPPLTETEMEAISRIDKNCRLIKGQVFLWKENQSWEDLWDLEGEIAK